MYGKAALLAVLAVWLLGLSAWAQDPQLQPAVHDTAVRAQLTSGTVGAETLAQLEQAINETVHTALIEQLGGDLEYIRRHQHAVVQTLGEVIAPVLSKRGFTLEELSLDPGEISTVTVSLHLTEQLVESFNVQFHLLGNTPVIEELVAADEEAVASALYATVARTPYGDTRWFTGLVTDTVERALSSLDGYGDFEHMVLVEPGATTKVGINFTPRQGVSALGDYTLTLSSLTLLNAMLSPVRDRVAHNIQSLLGAPLCFLTPRLAQIERAMYQDLVNCSTLAGCDANACLTLSLRGCMLHANLYVDSERYLLRLGAKLDLWNHGDQHDYLGLLHGRAGLMLSPDWTAYAAASYYPAAGETYPMLGIGHLWRPQGFIGAGYDFTAKAARFQAQHAFSPVVYISGDIITGHGYKALSEIALHYRIRDFYELQLISNLNGEVYAAAAANF
jgi:hypothetical protein